MRSGEVPKGDIDTKSQVNFSQVMRRVEEWEEMTHEILFGLGLHELLSMRKGLRNLGDDLHSIEPLKLDIDGNIDALPLLNQSLARLAILNARKRVLDTLDRRIRSLRSVSGTPTLGQIEDRHEQGEYTPPHYPNWTEKKWRALWKNQRKLERESRYQAQLAEWKRERAEEEEKIEKEGLATRLLLTLTERINHLEEEEQKRREHIATVIAHKMRNEARENEAILTGFYSYTHAFLDAELYFALDYNLSRKSVEAGKKNKKFYDAVIAILKGELTKRGLPHQTRDEIRKGHASLTEMERETFINQVL